jgi:formylmethanofuran--tetrahydromethanopterin N-formyltransferase
MIVVPIMVPDFQIERYLGYGVGIMGANFWYMCKTKKAVIEAGEAALEAIRHVKGVITPFQICSAGSKPESKFPLIGPTTNHLFCPSLRKRVGTESKVPEKVKYIPEIVINGVSLEAVKTAMRMGIETVVKFKEVVKVSAGNYGGKLGTYRIPLRALTASLTEK